MNSKVVTLNWTLWCLTVCFILLHTVCSGAAMCQLGYVIKSHLKTLGQSRLLGPMLFLLSPSTCSSWATSPAYAHDISLILASDHWSALSLFPEIWKNVCTAASTAARAKGLSVRAHGAVTCINKSDCVVKATHDERARLSYNQTLV